MTAQETIKLSISANLFIFILIIIFFELTKVAILSLYRTNIERKRCLAVFFCRKKSLLKGKAITL